MTSNTAAIDLINSIDITPLIILSLVGFIISYYQIMKTLRDNIKHTRPLISHGTTRKNSSGPNNSRNTKIRGIKKPLGR